MTLAHGERLFEEHLPRRRPRITNQRDARRQVERIVHRVEARQSVDETRNEVEPGEVHLPRGLRDLEARPDRGDLPVLHQHRRHRGLGEGAGGPPSRLEGVHRCADEGDGLEKEDVHGLDLVRWTRGGTACPGDAARPGGLRFPMTSHAQVQVGLERLPQGPWIYARLMDERGSHGAEDGAIVEVIDGAGRFCGHGLYNSSSDIRVRMLSRGRRSDLDRSQEVPQAADRGRTRLEAPHSPPRGGDGHLRVVHAEGDDLSGLIVDKLGDALVCQYHALWSWRLREDVEAILRELLPGHLVLHRFARAVCRGEGLDPDAELEGEEQADPRYVQEHGVRFLVHPGASHKTGVVLRPAGQPASPGSPRPRMEPSWTCAATRG